MIENKKETMTQKYFLSKTIYDKKFKSDNLKVFLMIKKDAKISIVQPKFSKFLMPPNSSIVNDE